MNEKILEKPEPGASSEGVLPRHELSMALRRAYLRLHRDTCEHCEKEGITGDQFVLMNIIKSSENATQSDLAILNDSDPNTVSAMLQRLQAKELVRRKKHPEDKRINLIELTPKGLRLLAVLEEKTWKNRHEMENMFTSTELKKLISLLQRLARDRDK